MALAMLAIDERDKSYWEERLVEEGDYTAEELERKPDAWWKPRCRRWFPSSSDELWERMDAVYNKFEDAVDATNTGKRLFCAEDMARIHRTTHMLIKIGLLGDPASENMYFFTSEDGENPRFKTKGAAASSRPCGKPWKRYAPDRCAAQRPLIMPSLILLSFGT